MNINYISLGSFCHPKIFLRNTNREILKSLPFDFNSTPNTYSIYNILNKLHDKKTYSHQFKEIIFEHDYNSENKKELAVSDMEDIFFLHFFDLNDKLNDNTDYPINVVDNLNNDKINEVTNKFTKRYELLYKTLNQKNNLLCILRIENYENKYWKTDVKNLVDSLKKYNNPNIFLIYTQIEIDEKLDFYKTNKINYDFNFPIIFYKTLFNEKISTDTEENKKFSNILTNFENLINSCLLINLNDNINYYYYDKHNNIILKINDINIIFKVNSYNYKSIEIIFEGRFIIFFKNNQNIFEKIN